MANNPDQPSESPDDRAQDVSPSAPDQPADTSPTAGQVAEQSLESAEMAAEQIRKETADPPPAGTGNPATIDLPQFEKGEHVSSDPAAALGMLNDIDLQVKVELGRTRMYIEDVLKLNANSIVELDKAAGDPVDIYVNDRHVARGEVLVLSDNFCVRVSEIIKQGEEEA